MSEKTASCQCGQLSITVDSKPKFVNACACTKCQKESGGPIHIGVFYAEGRVIEQNGVSKIFTRTTDKGNTAIKHFCPHCGSEVFWFTGAVPNCIGVSWGALGDNSLKPNWCVWTRSLPDWMSLGSMKQFDTQPD